MKFNPHELVQQVLKESSLTGVKLEKKIADSIEKAYWLSLNPLLSIEETSIPPKECEVLLTKEEIFAANGQFHKEGYFQARSVTTSAFMATLLNCITTLRSNGWPPVFAMVYDQFWQIARSSSLTMLLDSVLGHQWKQTCHFWLYFVDRKEKGKGWPPHVDGRRKGLRISVWIPISDATLENGCMYIVPANRISPDAQQAFCDSNEISSEHVAELLQNCRALPAPAGSVLSWSYDVIHWGSVCNDSAQNPRVSLGLSFISNQTEPTEKEHPLIGSGVPKFDERLRLIARNILTYSIREPLMVQYEEFSKSLLRLP